MTLSLSCALLAVLSATPQERLDLPSCDVVAVAQGRSRTLPAALRVGVEEHVLAHRIRGRILWLEGWRAKDQARARAEGVSFVAVIDVAKSKRTRPVTGDYTGPKGESRRIRYTGAESEVELRAFRRGPDSEWVELVCRSGTRATADPPSTLFIDAGAEDTFVVSPERQLGDLLQGQLAAGFDALAAEALWRERAAIRARAGELTLADQEELWALAAEALSSTARSYPRASLCAAADSAWGAWEHELSEREFNPRVRRCDWCGAFDSAPECTEARRLKDLIDATRVLLTPLDRATNYTGRPDRTEGLKGTSPSGIRSRIAPLRAALRAQPGADLACADRRFQGPRVHKPLATRYVIVVGDEFPPDLLVDLDPDFVLPAHERIRRGPDSFARTLRGWGIRKNPPFAGVVRRTRGLQERNSVLEQYVRGADLDAERLQELLEDVLWSELGGD